MGRKCYVQGCLSDSNREEDIGVTFHKVPMQPDVRLKWLQLCRISEEKKSIKVIHVCSRHFLRADFCNFKGKKYMLRQGVFPSVFPWDKSKLEAIKSEKLQIKSQTASNVVTQSEKVEEKIEPESNPTTSSPLQLDDQIDIKEEPVCTDSIDFFTDNDINVLDFNNKWCPAKIVEVDERENEVLIHFERNGNEVDEWICMDSPRLKPSSWKDESAKMEENLSPIDENEPEASLLEKETFKDDTKKIIPLKFDSGERCFAFWNDRQKFLATITKILDNDNYEVLFDDGYVKMLEWSKLVKINQNMQSSPLFDPVQSTKQERRDKKRKINVAELFGIGKRQRTEGSPNSPKVKSSFSQMADVSRSVVEGENWESEAISKDTGSDEFKWLPRWVDGHPVGIESQLELKEGKKKTVIIADPRLPEGWTKHMFKKRLQIYNGGKWDIIIVSPDGRKMRSKTDVKNYLENTKLMPYDEKMFDFRIYPHRQKKTASESRKNVAEPKTVPTVEPSEDDRPITPEVNNEDQANLLKIPLCDEGYKCPIEGCDKAFRKENLAQMHVKHYHPEYSKFLDTTPNVADLAYARTVGDSLDKSPVHTKISRPKHNPSKTSTPGQLNSPVIQDSETSTSSQPTPTPSRTKDSEIIKLLNAKPFDVKSEGEFLPSGLPASMYPDIKLRDLLSKSEGVPPDAHLKSLSGTPKAAAGIKTLLPVRKLDVNADDEDGFQEVTPKIKSKSGGKRRKMVNLNEQLEPSKIVEVKEELPSQLSTNQTEPPFPPQLPEPNNVIIEGGELIKIVRMKQEEIINCTCGFTEEDGLMIQCELCLCWQHAYCNNIQKESEVPDKYVCYICQHPNRQRSSRRFYHDQDWLKQGTLPVAGYHAKDEEALQKRFEKLKKAHDVSGGLVELQDFVNTLKVKQKIAIAKNHPKLYLWSKPWEKLPLPERMDNDHKDPIKEENEEESQLNRELKSMFDSSQPQVPMIPQPEAAIETADCKLNLLDHILHSQNLVMERLDDFEKELDKLEDSLPQFEKDQYHPRTRQTLQMLMRDLNKLEELSQNTSI